MVCSKCNTNNSSGLAGNPPKVISFEVTPLQWEQLKIWVCIFPIKGRHTILTAHIPRWVFHFKATHRGKRAVTPVSNTTTYIFLEAVREFIYPAPMVSVLLFATNRQTNKELCTQQLNVKSNSQPAWRFVFAYSFTVIFSIIKIHAGVHIKL